MSIRDRLASIYLEAEQLRGRHDGVHDMHGACAAIWTALQSLDSGYKVNMDHVDLIIRKMRFCDVHGRYPRRGEVGTFNHETGEVTWT